MQIKSPNVQYLLISFAPSSGIGFYQLEDEIHQFDLVIENDIVLNDLTPLSLEFDQVQISRYFDSLDNLLASAKKEYLRDKKNNYYKILLTQNLSNNIYHETLRLLDQPEFHDLYISKHYIEDLNEKADPNLVLSIIQKVSTSQLENVKDCLRQEFKEIIFSNRIKKFLIQYPFSTEYENSMKSNFNFDKIPNSLKRLNETFRKRSEKENNILKDGEEIEIYLDNFINTNPSFDKILNILRLSLKDQTTFKLQPLVVKFNNKNNFDIGGHCAGIISRETNHPVLIFPESTILGSYYEYKMAFSIEDFMDIRDNCSVQEQSFKDENRILSNAFDIINDCIMPEFKKLIFSIEPEGIANRLAGYDGSFILFSMKLIDNKEIFWSSPVVRSPYNRAQPFLIARDGEFLVLIKDGTNSCLNTTASVINEIKERMNYNKSLSFKQEKEITVNRSWIVAHGLPYVDQYYRINEFKDALIGLFGEHVSYPTLSNEFDMTSELFLETIGRDITGQLMHIFDRKLVKDYSIFNT